MTKLQSLVSDFKIGQVVKLTNMLDSPLSTKIGAKAIVYSLKEMPNYLTVKWINAPEQDNGGYYPNHFTIVGMASKEELFFLLKDKLISNLEYLEALSEK